MTAAARQLTKIVVAERAKAVYGFCPYCGRPCRGSACRFDMDLVALERELYLESNEAAASLDLGSATTSQPEGV